MKKLILTTLLAAAFSSLAYANPKIFNMEVGKTTEQEVKEKYSLKADGENLYSQGNQYYIDPKDIEMDDLISSLVIFDDKGVLVGVISKFSETNHMKHQKFEYLYSILASKYKLIKKQKPFVGDRYAKFKDGNVEILLDAPHLGGFKINLEYLTNDFLNTFKKKSTENRNSKKKEDESLL
ncbi:hypothetical protein ACWIYZ_11340 [Ursidibacter arcticus]